MFPIPVFFNLEQFTRDLVEITDSARGPAATKALATLPLLRNFESRKTPAGFGPEQFRGLLEDCFYQVAGSGHDWSEKAYSYDERFRIMPPARCGFKTPSIMALRRWPARQPRLPPKKAKSVSRLTTPAAGDGVVRHAAIISLPR